MTQRELVLDIAMNLTRMGNWAADGYEARKKRINFFLDQTNRMIGELDKEALPQRFQPTVQRFRKAFVSLRRTPTDALAWAEDMMTWGSILTHRSKLLDPFL